MGGWKGASGANPGVGGHEARLGTFIAGASRRCACLKAPLCAIAALTAPCSRWVNGPEGNSPSRTAVDLWASFFSPLRGIFACLLLLCSLQGSAAAARGPDGGPPIPILKQGGKGGRPLASVWRGRKTRHAPHPAPQLPTTQHHLHLRTQANEAVAAQAPPEAAAPAAAPPAPAAAPPAPAAAPPVAPPSLPVAAPHAAAPPAPPPFAGLNPALAAALARAPGLQGLSPAIAQQLLAAAAAIQAAGGAQGMAAAAAAAAKPQFNLMAILGDTSQGVTPAQALTLQRTIRSLKDPALAVNLVPLANMEVNALLTLLTSQSVNVREVVAKLERHVDPVKAREQFGDGYNYGPPPAAPTPNLQQILANAAAAAAAGAGGRPPAPNISQLLLNQAAAVAAAAAAGRAAGLGAPQAQALAQQAAAGFLRPPLGQAMQPGLVQRFSLPQPGAAAGGTGAGALLGAQAAAGPAGPPKVEPIERTLIRLQPGTAKHAIFEMLLKSGKRVSLMCVCVRVRACARVCALVCMCRAVALKAGTPSGLTATCVCCNLTFLPLLSVLTCMATQGTHLYLHLRPVMVLIFAN